MYAVSALWDAVDKESPKRKTDSVFETVTSYYKAIYGYTSCSYN